LSYFLLPSQYKQTAKLCSIVQILLKSSKLSWVRAGVHGKVQTAVPPQKKATRTTNPTTQDSPGSKVEEFKIFLQ
jgi:hypothetical protein